MSKRKPTGKLWKCNHCNFIVAEQLLETVGTLNTMLWLDQKGNALGDPEECPVCHTWLLPNDQFFPSDKDADTVHKQG